jgi:hypothetical protein
MKKLSILLILSLVALLTGCTPVDSLNPLYTDKDVIFDPALLGQWGSDTEGYNFAKGEDGAYQITISSKDDKTGQLVSLVYEAHLVELQSHRFLDVVPKQWTPSPQSVPLDLERSSTGVQVRPGLVNIGSGAYVEITDGESNANGDHFKLRTRTAHNFYKVLLENRGQTLRLVELDSSWVEQQIERGSLSIDYQMAGSDHPCVVLTANTRDLQQLVVNHVDDEEAFNGTTTLDRPGLPAPSVPGVRYPQ